MALWNHVHGELGGFVSRSVDHWRWNILSRPGVNPDDIVIIEFRGRIEAYGVLGPRASVLELAASRDLGWWNRRRVFRLLLQSIEDHARARGDAALKFASSSHDRLVDGMLRDAGYVVTQEDYLSLGALNPTELMRRLLTHYADKLHAAWGRSFALDLSPGRYRDVQHARIRILVNRGSLVVYHDASAEPNDCCITTDLETLTGIIFGQVLFEQAFVDGRILVRNPAQGNEVATLFGAMTIASPWFSPLADAF